MVQELGPNGYLPGLPLLSCSVISERVRQLSSRGSQQDSQSVPWKSWFTNTKEHTRVPDPRK